MRGSLPLALAAVILSIGAVGLLAFGNITTAMAIAIAISAILLGVLALSRPQQRTSVLICIALTSFAAPSFVFVPSDTIALSLIFRLAGLALIALTLSSSTATVKLSASELRWVWLFVVPIEIFILCATAPHGKWGDLITYSLGAVVLALTLISISKLRTSASVVANAIWLMLIVMAFASLALGAFLPNIGMEGGRLRGIFENSNSMGFFAFLLISATILVRRPSWMSVLAVLAGSVILVLSASRASALAAAIVVASWLVSRRPLATIVGALLVGALMLAFVAFDSSLQALLLRGNDSRSDGFAVAITEGLSSPLFGIGLSNESLQIASSPLRAFSNAGAVGLIAILLLWILLGFSTLRARPRATWFAVAAIVHSAFEGWLLSPISPLLVVFAALWWAVTRVLSTEDQTPRREVIATEQSCRGSRVSRYRTNRYLRVDAVTQNDRDS